MLPGAQVAAPTRRSRRRPITDVMEQLEKCEHDQEQPCPSQPAHLPRIQLADHLRASSAFLNACHAARCVARQAVRSQAVPVALAAMCAARWSCGWAYAGSSSAFVRRARPTSIRVSTLGRPSRRTTGRGCPRGPVVALARLLCDPAVSEAPDRDPSAPLATSNLETPNSNPSRSRPPPDCRLARPSTSTQALEPGSLDHVEEVGQQHTLRGWRPEEEPAT